MDINCTLSCTHQNNGKCYLDEINSQIQLMDTEDVDCPYYFRKQPKVNTCKYNS